MRLPIMSKEKASAGHVELPRQFSEPVRVDLIRRAVLVAQANGRQPYGAYEEAGMRHTTDLSKRRRHYRGCYGFGISRTPRKIMSRSGTRFGWVGAFAPNTVGGRRSHPPKDFKVWEKGLNIKERRKAIRSALAATMDAELVRLRGHRLPEGFPFAVDTDVESIIKVKDALAVLERLGFAEDLARCESRTRAGKGKLRGRRKVVARSVLIVVSGDCPLIRAVRNIPGVDVSRVENLGAEILAPGAHPGRLTLFTKQALMRLEKEELFMNVRGAGISDAAVSAAHAGVSLPKAAPVKAVKKSAGSAVAGAQVQVAKKKVARKVDA
ncbi:MAG: 50S ribosomal protein L4 [Nitrosarchaeum sp.]|nr:50S ribosomal protein L4 [Nitrosarchaeum sp.]